MAVNGEHCFVTGVARYFLHVLVVSAKRNGKAVDFYAKPLFEQLLTADDFILDPLLVLCAGQFLFGPFVAGLDHHDGVALAQILVGRRVRFDIDPVVAHVSQHFPGDRLSTAQASTRHALGVNEHGKGVAEFFHDRPRDFILRFPAVVERNHGAPRRNVFLAALPSEQIL